jgi:MSHA biogenesis protein MshO
VKTYSLTRKGYPFKTGIMSSGFTLIELIAVIVILSIIATIGTGFVVKTTEAYQRTQTRALLVNTSRQALERMTRQLRIALPYSLQPTNGGNCLKFLPIVGGGNYFEPVPDLANKATGSDQILASPPQVDFGLPVYITIGAMSAGELYGAANNSIAAGGYTNGVLQLTSSKQWQRNSINQRYFLVDNPQAFCVVGNELRFYDGINLNAGDVNVTDGYSLLARNIDAQKSTDPAFFALSNGSENRHTHVKISLRFANGDESILYTQGAFIRNVP